MLRRTELCMCMHIFQIYDLTKKKQKKNKQSLLLAQYTFLAMFNTFNTLFMVILKIAIPCRLQLIFIR